MVSRIGMNQIIHIRPTYAAVDGSSVCLSPCAGVVGSGFSFITGGGSGRTKNTGGRGIGKTAAVHCSNTADQRRSEGLVSNFRIAKTIPAEKGRKIINEQTNSGGGIRRRHQFGGAYNDNNNISYGHQIHSNYQQQHQQGKSGGGNSSSHDQQSSRGSFHQQQQQQQKCSHILLGSSGFFFVSGYKLKHGQKVKDPQSVEEIALRADADFDEFRLLDSYERLKPFRGCDSPEVLWRYARVVHELAKMSTTEKERERHAIDGFEVIRKARKLGLEQNCPEMGQIHKWNAQMTDTYGLSAMNNGWRLRRINYLRRELDKALELRPLDPDIWYLSGEWHFHLADTMKVFQILRSVWYWKRIPDSTYEAALHDYKMAMELSQGKSSIHMVGVAKVYARLGQEQDAIDLLRRAYFRVVASPDDFVAHHLAGFELSKLRGIYEDEIEERIAAGWRSFGTKLESGQTIDPEELIAWDEHREQNKGK